MKIQRLLLAQIRDSLIPGKVLVLYGPRQVGKTTLDNDLLASISLRSRFVNADELIYREPLSSQNRQRLGEVLGDAELLIIDEAQRVPNIGINLKILINGFPGAITIATGSASFDLANKISEPLTGRTLTFNLHPVSYPEIRLAPASQATSTTPDPTRRQPIRLDRFCCHFLGKFTETIYFPN